MYFTILAGGSGKRFWPVGRETLPKQFLNIIDDRTMLEHTIDRIKPIAQKGKIFVIVTEAYKQIVESIIQKRYSNLGIRIIYEPFAKNTAPAIAIASEIIYREDKNAIITSLPTDHYIAKEDEFLILLNNGMEVASKTDNIVLFGIKPTYASTSYGYIEFDWSYSKSGVDDAFSVISFKEKPDKSTAKQYLTGGNYLWNSGIFLWKAGRILDELHRFEPEMYKIVKSINMNSKDDLKEMFSAVKSISIDNAVLERTDNILVIPTDIGWNDIGSWDAIYNIKSDGKKISNVLSENSIAYNSKGCMIQSNGEKLIAIVGLEDILVIESDDAILITKKSDVENVKNLYEKMEKDGQYKKYL
jgi:mannose-1-phosphate guanylyltransferase